MALGIGATLVILQRPIGNLALELLGGTQEVESLTRGYFFIRIWGAPASLATFALMGTFVGLGRSDRLLQSQLVLNGLNIVLDVPDWILKLDADHAKQLAERAVRYYRDVHTALCQRAKADPKLSGMGTTMTATRPTM